jgi:hypothetical protein
VKGLIELIGIVLVIQGAGGLVTALLDGSRSWFLVRHVLPEELQVPASVVVLLLGLLLLWRNRDRKPA